MMALLASDVADATEEVLASEVEVAVEGEDLGDAYEEPDDPTTMEPFLLKQSSDESDKGPAVRSLSSGDRVLQPHRLTSATGGPSTSTRSEGEFTQLFQNQLEHEIRSFVAALELVPGPVARERAQALTERLLLQFRPTGGAILESALVTSLSEGVFEESHMMTYATLSAQEQDFVDYWWGLLMRQLRKYIDGPAGLRRETVPPVVHRRHVAAEGL